MSVRQLNPLTALEDTIRAHWRTYRPGMSAELEAAGLLEESIRRAAANTRAAVQELVERGCDMLAAWEAVREEWAILPAEEEDEVDDGDGLDWWSDLWSVDDEED